jgi:hypothetical protein
VRKEISCKARKELALAATFNYLTKSISRKVRKEMSCKARKELALAATFHSSLFT